MSLWTGILFSRLQPSQTAYCVEDYRLHVLTRQRYPQNHNHALREIFQGFTSPSASPHLWQIACLSSNYDLGSSISQRSSFLLCTHGCLQIPRFYLDTSRSKQNATRLSISSVTNHTTGMENLPTLSTTLAFWTLIISETTSINNCTSFQSLQWKTGEKIKYGKLSVRFYDEKGMNVGGVTRECFQISESLRAIVCSILLATTLCFQPYSADRLTYSARRLGSIQNTHHFSCLWVA